MVGMSLTLCVSAIGHKNLSLFVYLRGI